MSQVRALVSAHCFCGGCGPCRDRAIAAGKARLAAEAQAEQTGAVVVPARWGRGVDEVTRQAWATVLPPEWAALWSRPVTPPAPRDARNRWPGNGTAAAKELCAQWRKAVSDSSKSEAERLL